MSQANVEIVRQLYSLMSERGFLSTAPDIYAAYCRPDAELVPPEIYPDTQQCYSSLEGFQRFQRQLDEIWDDWRVEAERFFDAGDQVVVFVGISATGKQSRAAITISTAHLLIVNDERVARIEIFLDRSEALKAAGLSG